MSWLFNLSERINFLILKYKRNKKYILRNSEIGINLGSEDNTIKEYVGIDGSIIIYLTKSRMPTFFKKYFYNKSCSSVNRSYKDFYLNSKSKRIIHHNLIYNIPFKTNSVPYIYTSHFLEHLNKTDAIKTLTESYRCLKYGGILRIVVPDLDDEVKKMESAIQKYKKGDSDSVQEFITSDGNIHNHFSIHRRIYNFSDFQKILASIGFSDIKRKNFKEGNLPLVKKIETRAGLIIEAKKL